MSSDKFIRYISLYCKDADKVLLDVKEQCLNTMISFDHVSEHFVENFSEMTPFLLPSDFFTYVNANIMAFANNGEL